MSDSKSSYGDPVEEPRPVDDVVSSANDTIADAGTTDLATFNAIRDATRRATHNALSRSSQ